MLIGAGAIIFIALIVISATVALVLAVAWHEFGRPPHAFTWSAAFALSAIMWTIDLIARIERPIGGGVGGPMLAIAGIATMLNTLGFRQRAGMDVRLGRLVAAALVNGVLVTLLAAVGASAVARATPFGLLNAVMFWLAARALTGRRRKGERVAARVAQAGLILLSGVNLAFLAGMIGSLIGVPLFDLNILGTAMILLMPGIITGIGLFTVILLAADLADQARRLAATDMLTGLLNRRGFDEAGRALIESARRRSRSMAVVMIDVDRFKDVNDRFGHPAGDRVLCQICSAIAAGIDRRDLFARIGGEEFALVLADADLAAAECAAEVLRGAVAELKADLAEPHRVTASFGVAELREGDRDLTDVCKRADEALYRAKETGRDRVVVAA
jgi:diguanylate cyclase (GGDEF)-like protein